MKKIIFIILLILLFSSVSVISANEASTSVILSYVVKQEAPVFELLVSKEESGGYSNSAIEYLLSEWDLGSGEAKTFYFKIRQTNIANWNSKSAKIKISAGSLVNTISEYIHTDPPEISNLQFSELAIEEGISGYISESDSSITINYPDESISSNLDVVSFACTWRGKVGIHSGDYKTTVVLSYSVD